MGRGSQGPRLHDALAGEALRVCERVRMQCLQSAPHATPCAAHFGSCLQAAPCPLAADYDAMVSKMTITELVALKQAGSRGGR